MTTRVLPWAGFAPLRAGKIHLFCLKCHRKLSNMPRGKYDPPRATLVQSFCDRCGAGGKDPSEYFFDARGKEIGWKEIDRTLNRVLKAEGIQ